MTWTLVILEQAWPLTMELRVIRRSWLNMSKSLTYLVFFGRFSINGGQNIFLSFSFLIVNSLSPGKRQIFSFDSSQSIEHHFDFPLLIAQSILWYLCRASNWERFGLHRPTTLFVFVDDLMTRSLRSCPLPLIPLSLTGRPAGGIEEGGRGGGVWASRHPRLETEPRGKGEGILPFMANTASKGEPFFSFRYIKREGISLVEVRKRVVKLHVNGRYRHVYIPYKIFHLFGFPSWKSSDPKITIL